MERIYGCLYVHFEAILSFIRNEQMGCLEALLGNTNGAKHPRNVTSHVGYPKNASGEIMTRPENVENVSKTAKIKGYNTRFRTFPWPELRTPQ